MTTSHMQAPILSPQPGAVTPVKVCAGILAPDAAVAHKIQCVLAASSLLAACVVGGSAVAVAEVYLHYGRLDPVHLVTAGLILLFPLCGFTGSKNRNKGALCVSLAAGVDPASHAPRSLHAEWNSSSDVLTCGRASAVAVHELLLIRRCDLRAARESPANFASFTIAACWCAVVVSRRQGGKE